jgi:maltose O-acetyltransferase
MMNRTDLWINIRSVLAARWYLRKADSVGERVRLRGRRPIVRNDGRMVIGSRVQLISTAATLELVSIHGGTLEIGDRALINFGGSIAAAKLVRIGPRCLIGPHVLMMDTDFHRIEPERRLEMPEPKSIILEENVWIGARVVVLPGVTIGADSCIGSGSVVTEDIPPRVFAAGIPARVIRKL